MLYLGPLKSGVVCETLVADCTAGISGFLLEGLSGGSFGIQLALHESQSSNAGSQLFEALPLTGLKLGYKV